MPKRLQKSHPLRIFFFSGLVSIAVLWTIGATNGTQALLLTLVLSLVEITFSFDNAIINARILSKMSLFWQQMFLTVGILIAVFGMRLIFPVVLVMLTAGISGANVIDLVLHHPAVYAEKLQHAHPYISAFGGMFLLMLSLAFFFDTDKTIHWIAKIERPVSKRGTWIVYTGISTILLAIIVALPSNHYQKQTLMAGGIGIISYLLLHLFTKTTEPSGVSNKQKTGLAAFVSFCYLQVLDASFSFDGVIGAFAITQNVVIIAAGLGIGAVWVRSLTILMVRKGTLDSYKYLEHGAHYTIGMLAAIFLAGLFVSIPEAVTGGAGLIIIGLSIGSSIIEKRLNG
jgi:hypothetical protein